MRALYLGGRQAEALEAYKRARTKLDELGIEPSAELKRLQSQILRQDPALDAPRTPRGTRPPAATARQLPHPRRRRVLALAGAVLLAVAAGITVLTHDGSQDTAPVAPALNSVRVIDLVSNKAVASVPIGGTPGGLSLDGEAVWVANEDDDTLLRIDPATSKVVQTIGVPGVTDVAAGAGALWAVGGDGAAILRVQPQHPDLSRALPIEKLTDIWDPAEIGHWIAFGAGSVWTLNGPAGLARIDPTSGDLVSRIALTGSSPDEIAFGAGSLWIADAVNHQLLEVTRRQRKSFEEQLSEEVQSPSLSATGQSGWSTIRPTSSGVSTPSSTWSSGRSRSATGRCRSRLAEAPSGSPTATTRPLPRSTPRRTGQSGRSTWDTCRPASRLATGSSGSSPTR